MRSAQRLLLTSRPVIAGTAGIITGVAFVTDDMTGTDGALLSGHNTTLPGGPWTVVTGSGSTAFTITSNRARFTGSGAIRMYPPGTPADASYSASALFFNAGFTGSQTCGVGVRCSTGEVTGYEAVFIYAGAGLGAWRLRKLANNIATTLQEITNTSSPGTSGTTTIGLTATDDGAGGVDLVATMTGKANLTFKDTASPILTAGSPVLLISNGGSTTGFHCDSFSASN